MAGCDAFAVEAATDVAGMGALVRVHWLAGFADIEPGAMIVTMVVSVIMLAESDFVIMGMAAMPQAEACEELMRLRNLVDAFTVSWPRSAKVNASTRFVGGVR